MAGIVVGEGRGGRLCALDLRYENIEDSRWDGTIHIVLEYIDIYIYMMKVER